MDGQLKWKLYREGKLPEPPGGACEEFSYAERPSFRALPEEVVRRQERERAERASRDADFREIFRGMRSRKQNSDAATRPGTTS
jgi:hypothetical protein